MNRRLTVSLLIGILVLSVIFLVAVPVVRSGNSASGDDSSSFVPFIPIWFAAIVPILVKKREDYEAQEKAKRKIKNSDRFQMMRHLVKQLNDEELDYLHQKITKQSPHL